MVIANCEVERIICAKKHLSHLEKLDKEFPEEILIFVSGWSCSNQVNQIAVTVREGENQWKRSAGRSLA